jgi:hypothetical protein
VVNTLHFDLARALWESGKDRTRAVALARQAHAALARSDDKETAEAAATWLAAHGVASR